MVTQTTLTDVLVEAGFEPEAARRAIEMIEQDLSGLARQSEVDLRFDRVDERFIAQDQLIEARFDGVDRQFRAIDKQFDGVDRQFDGVNKRIDDTSNNTDRRISLLTWVIGLLFVAMVTGFGVLFALVLELLSRPP